MTWATGFRFTACALLGALLALAGGPLEAQEPTPSDGPLPDAMTPIPADPPESLVHEAEEERETSWAVLPGLFYSQETSLGFALVGSVSFFPEDEPSTSQASRIMVLTTATLNKQVSVSLLPHFRLSDDAWLLTGDYVFSLFPDRFYSFGNDSANVYQRYTPRFANFESEVQRALTNRVWVGLLHRALLYDIKEFGGVYNSDDNRIDSEPLLNPSVPGTEGGFTHGFGLSFIVDSRDNVYVPESGTRFYTSLLGFFPWLGSNYEFGQWILDLTQVVLLIPSLHHTLALQLLSEVSIGQPPFYQMPKIGGSVIMRGFFEGRFRDKNLIVLQAEYRFPIVWRLAAAVFGNVGEVYGSTPFRFDRLTWTAGGGLRLLIGADIIVRADVGAGPDTFGFMLDVGYPF